jgi:phosphoribosylamine--glycine ligase
MRVLLIGSGGREHALAWRIAQSDRVERLYIAPGNAGMTGLGRCIDLDFNSPAAVAEFCLMYDISLVVVGPEAPLVAGLADRLFSEGIPVFGPSAKAARLEGSKAFTKALCDEFSIPTAAYASFDEEGPALAFVRERGAPIVIKADGLAAGKGVTVAVTLAQAEAAVHDCFAGTFGSAGARVVIEEYLEGEEVSLFAVSDGDHFIVLESVQDHKRAFDGDTGPNTGGMGAYSPAPAMTADLVERATRDIIAPTIAGMKARGTPFRGVLFAGLMLTADGPKLIEYNVRFGDPEAQVLMMRLKSDVVDLLEAAARHNLVGQQVEWHQKAALTVVMAAAGYPGDYQKGTEIRGAEGLDSDTLQVFHAGTRRDGDRLLSNGGRVLDVTALGDTVAEAQSRAYAAVDAIEWPQGFCRRDIGWRAILNA